MSAESKTFVGKSILLGVPSDFQLDVRFEENLKHLGFVVHRMPERASKVNIPLKDVFIHIVRKLLFKDKTYKPKIKGKLREPNDVEFIKKVGQVDYALFIRADQFSFQTIETVKRFSKKIVAYQWDGIERFPLIKQYIGLFDKFYIFDKNDVGINSSFIPITNFYFDDLLPDPKIIKERSVFFVGTYMKNRIKRLEFISEFLLKHNLMPNFYLFKAKKCGKLNDYMRIISKPFSFKQNILKVQQSEYVLDLHNPVHNGLSFRTFESVGYRKKLITNNVLVKEYDFYNPVNIFVLEEDSDDDFKRFLETPYQQLEEKIIVKYSFTYWISRVLE
ncbi:hypothetical protein CAPN004_02860 [Capnocytophaga cynodegmi]|uniref:hypothetical protein n=1 Tax=Capnocytophaga cynodegmi TaxID=28189 RepID=UPI001AC04BF6|nr:hypothetical protein [Capnocytophaga cynodegmi]GIM51256.1 hypothetical protein CAPN004_02860 [Capnocytophaga cynodegmi]